MSAYFTQTGCSDQELVSACQAGHLPAFEELFRRYDRPVFHMLSRMMGNPEDAEDVKQEAFVRAYRSIGRFRGDCAFSTWIYRIALNVCRDQLRRQKCRPVECVPDEVLDRCPSRAEGGGNPAREWERAELRRRVRETLATLPDHYRELIVLRDMEGHSYEEIAELLGCSLTSLKVRLHRARQMLKRKVEPWL